VGSAVTQEMPFSIRGSWVDEVSPSMLLQHAQGSQFALRESSVQRGVVVILKGVPENELPIRTCKWAKSAADNSLRNRYTSPNHQSVRNRSAVQPAAVDG
jgi:hypothetical protein